MNEDNCLAFLDAAAMMQLPHINQLCIVYLDKHLNITPDNSLQWWSRLKIYNLLHFAKRAFYFLTEYCPGD